MWADNPHDTVNVNERVIVSAEDLAAYGSGNWEVRVRSRNLATTTQTYSLVVTGPISPPDLALGIASFDTDDDAERSAAPPTVLGSSPIPLLLSAVATLAGLLIAF